MTNNQLTIGIDPGLSGALCILVGDSKEPIIYDTPTMKVSNGKKDKNEYNIPEMVGMLIRAKELSNDEGIHVYIEKVNARPGQGVTSMFSMGYGYGIWLGLLAALKIPHTRIIPQRWKKTMMTGMGKEKSASVYRGQQLFPQASLTGPKGGPLDGRGDALLIAEYGRTHELN